MAGIVGGMKVAEESREAVEECERMVTVPGTEADTLGVLVSASVASALGVVERVAAAPPSVVEEERVADTEGVSDSLSAGNPGVRDDVALGLPVTLLLSVALPLSVTLPLSVALRLPVTLPLPTIRHASAKDSAPPSPSPRP